MTLLPLADDPAGAVVAALEGRADGIVAPTSGSTGMPREVVLPAAAVEAAARASVDRLGGPAHWLLAVPDHRIAGAMVHARAHVSGTTVTRMSAGSFTASAFAHAAEAMPAGRRCVSLVPTQLRRLAADGAGAGALASFDAVLVGGAPPGMALPSNAVETYGMTETCGGCVYDGTPLDGVEVAIDEDGRILIAGPMLAAGYRDGRNEAFVERAGARWLRTSDQGAWDGARLTVLGRVDEVIITGGVNVHPAAVERALLALPEVTDVAVAGVPDPEWGEAVAAVIALAPGAEAAPGELPARAELTGAQRPRLILEVDAVPRTHAGKIDRDAVRAIAARVAKEDR